MKDIVPAPPPVIRNEHQAVVDLYQKHVVPSYGRFDVVFTRGQGNRLWDVHGRRYLDLGGGIAVTSLGHAHPEITKALIEQSQTLLHVSNLYYTEPQGLLAERIVRDLAPGRVFFCNSGAEANEGLFKLARKFGHEEGRFEILTTHNSFHGRTLAGIAATGQDKVKKGFEPMTPGFRQVPFNDLDAMRKALSPATVAIMVEGVQGEGGVTPATPGYLLGLRKLCDEKKLLLLMDGVQCGHFRTGRFQSFQRILETVQGAAGVSPADQTKGKGSEADATAGSSASSAADMEVENCRRDAGSTFLPDGISMAKSLGGGFPIGAFWLREPLGKLLGPGTHGTTYGGSPLGCAVALKIMEIIEREKLADNVRAVGGHLMQQLRRMQQEIPDIITNVRGLGFMLGVEFAEDLPGLKVEGKPPAVVFTARALEAGLVVVPAGARVIRLLPALNLTRAEANEGLEVLQQMCKTLA